MATSLTRARLWRGTRGMEALQSVLILGAAFVVIVGVRQAYKSHAEPAATEKIAEALGSEAKNAGGGNGESDKGDTGKPTNTGKNPGAGNTLDRDKLEAQLALHEGAKNTAYLDTKGHPTIGIGFNLDRADAKAKIEALGKDFEKIKSGKDTLTDSQIQQLFKSDLNSAIANTKAVIPNFADLSDVRQRVLTDMMFNLGRSKFEKFTEMIKAVKAGNFDKAADEMRNSLWFDQVKSRGPTLEGMMRNDVDPRGGFKKK